METQSIHAIDIHTHVGANVYNLLHTRYPIVQSLPDLISKARYSGISHLVVFPMPTPMYGFLTNNSQISVESHPYELANRHLLYEVERFGNGAAIPFMMIDPRAEIDRQIDFLTQTRRKYYGLKLHTKATFSKATDLIDSPFIELLKQNDMPISIHSKTSSENTHPKHIIRLAEQEPDIRICIAHLADLDEQILRRIATFDNLYVDTSPFLAICDMISQGMIASPNQMRLDPTDPITCLKTVYEVVPDQLLWGTDEPWTTVSDYEGNILAKHTYADEVLVLNTLPSEVRSAISRTNSLRYLFGDS